MRREDDPEATATSEKVELDLKPLPSNLRYAFHDSDSKYSFIVNSSFSNDCVDALCDKLNSHKNAIGYSINDRKGISPKICMHRILLRIMPNLPLKVKGD